jgi:hypothetical protein
VFGTPFPKENPSSREKSQTLPVLTETGRNHEKNVDFNHWDADQARQLFELVRDIETYQFSKQSRAVEEGLRKDLNELKKLQRERAASRIPCHLQRPVVHGTKGKSKQTSR